MQRPYTASLPSGHVDVHDENEAVASAEDHTKAIGEDLVGR